MVRILQLIQSIPIPAPMGRLGKSADTRRWHFQHLNRSLAANAALWDALNQQTTAGQPLLDSRFIEALLRHFGDGSEYLYQLENKGKPVTLGILKPTGFGVWTAFVPAQAPLAPLIQGDSTGFDKLLCGMPGLVWQVDLLCQDPQFSPLLQRHHLPLYRMHHVLTINIRLEGGFDTYWAARSKNLRAAMRTREHRLAGSGLKPHLVRIEAPEAMQEAVTRFGQLESSGWKGRAGTAVSADNIQGPFYRDIMEGFAQTGQAAVYEYWFGSRHAASELTLAGEGMIILLKTAYNEALAEWAPGRMLLREIIRDSFSRRPGGIIEFYTKANANELAWATSQRWIEHVSLYRNPAVARLLNTAKAARRWFSHRGN